MAYALRRSDANLEQFLFARGNILLGDVLVGSKGERSMSDTSIFPESDLHWLPGSLTPSTSNGVDDQPSVTMATPEVEDL
jgi:hypothetical protein